MLSTTAILRRAIPLAPILLGLTVTAPSIADPPDKTNSYQVQNLVSLAPPAGTIAAPHHDVNLQNGWGIVFNPTGPVWVSDNGTGKSTLYDGNGVPFPSTVPPGPLVVTIPAASGKPADTGTPTGIAFNASNDFVVPTTPNPPVSGRSVFLWASEDGAISGWAPNVNGTVAQTALVANAVYKGIAIAGDGSSGHFRLYAADFVGKKIDVYDDKFKPVVMPGAFVDPTIPNDFGPFNILNIQGNLYVSYAKTQPNSHDEAHGPGLGFVNVFDADGNLLMRLASRGKLNAPWGMALAPEGFGSFSHDILVGNFGDGTINAFDPHDGHFDGQLKTPDGKTLVIDGLWGIAFGNGINSQPMNTLFYAAGPNNESNGVYGRIDFH